MKSSGSAEGSPVKSLPIRLQAHRMAVGGVGEESENLVRRIRKEPEKAFEADCTRRELSRGRKARGANIENEKFIHKYRRDQQCIRKCIRQYIEVYSPRYSPIKTKEYSHKKFAAFVQTLHTRSAADFAAALGARWLSEMHSKRKGKTFAKIENDDWTRKFEEKNNAHTEIFLLLVSRLGT